MEKAEYVDRVAICEKVCTGCTMLVDGVCCDADPCENLIAGFLEEPPADVVPAHRKENAHSVPLTLDELREAAETGDPVWLVGLENGDRWVRIDGIDSLVVRFSMFGNSETWCFRTKSYGVRVWAYCQKPEEGTV